MDDVIGRARKIVEALRCCSISSGPERNCGECPRAMEDEPCPPLLEDAAGMIEALLWERETLLACGTREADK